MIHAVGPVWRGGSQGESRLLADAYVNSLALAVLENLKTIAFPSISTGAYRYPIEKASEIALTTAKQFLEKEAGFDEVVFVLFTKNDLEIYKEAAIKILYHTESGHTIV